MIGWLLDTNVIAALTNPNGARSVKTWANAVDERHLHISILTLAEYDKGIENLPPADPNRARYIGARDALEERFSHRTLPLDDETVRLWGQLSGRIKLATKQAPPVVDTLLAATALRHRLYLVTRNTRDVVHTGAAVFNPWNDNPSLYPISP